MNSEHSITSILRHKREDKRYIERRREREREEREETEASEKQEGGERAV